MTKLPTPEQWVLSRMDEMECAELIEQHIDFYVESKDGFRRSVHLEKEFVRHYLQRHDGALPTVVAIATAPLVLADGTLLAPDGLDRDRGIVFIIPKELRAIVPERKDCTKKAVKAAMDYLTDEWLCDVATDYAGKCITIAAALTLIERTLLPDRPAFFVTAGRRGGGKTTTLIMLIMAVTGLWPAAAAWSTNEEERRKALMSYFLYGVPYILWDNIARGMQISCPHIEKSCTAAYYSDRKFGVSEMVCTAASTIHFFTGNNIGPRGDLASRSLRHPSRRRSRRPREPGVQAPGPGWMDGEQSRRNPGGALHHPARQPAAQEAAQRGRQDPIQDVVAAGRLGGRECRQAGRAEARLPEPVHHARGGRRGEWRHSPTCSMSW